jgi:putative RNA 2'-phosphotransferase
MQFELTTMANRLHRCCSASERLHELELDGEGWASVESVLVALRKQRAAWASLAEGDLAHMIEASSKRRHEIKEGRIRALYGHSLAGKLKRTPAAPPSVLYHGAAPDVVSLTKSSGLLPMGRQYVHLSVDEATAVEVGRRKAKKPTILRVLAAEVQASDALPMHVPAKDLGNIICPDTYHIP